MKSHFDFQLITSIFRSNKHLYVTPISIKRITLPGLILSSLKKVIYGFVIILLSFIIVFEPANAQPPTPLWMPPPNTDSSIYNTNNGTNGYVGIGTGTVRNPAITKLQLFMPDDPDEDYNRLSLIIEANIEQNCHSFGELSVTNSPYLLSNEVFYSSFATVGDVVLRARWLYGIGL